MIQTQYVINKRADNDWRNIPWTRPTTVYFAAFVATISQSPRSATVTVGQTTFPAAPNGHMYRCTAATGATSSGEPTWPTTFGGTVVDGGVTWTEMGPDFLNQTGSLTEAAGNSYGRTSYTLSAANMSATNGPGTTTNPSSGSAAYVSNNNAIAYPTASGSGWGWCVYGGLFDASTSGNLLYYGPFTSPANITGSSTVLNLPPGTFKPILDQ